jgi:hypothetical protein
MNVLSLSFAALAMIVPISAQAQSGICRGKNPNGHTPWANIYNEYYVVLPHDYWGQCAVYNTGVDQCMPLCQFPTNRLDKKWQEHPPTVIVAPAKFQNRKN